MLDVQGAKDTFYATLRDRVAAGNAGRTVEVRGVLRPGVVVGENELPGAALDGIAPIEAFCMRWTGLRVETHGGPTIAALLCEIRYASDGSAGVAGMDRGRTLAAMDAELATAVATEPRAADAIANGAIGTGAAGAGGAAAGLPKVFWGEVTFGAAVMRGERMERTAEIEVFAYGN